MTTCEATIQGGQLVLNAPLPLADGTRVRVHIEPTDEDPLLFMAKHAVGTGVSDLADQHDHYAYGSPKGSS